VPMTSSGHAANAGAHAAVAKATAA